MAEVVALIPARAGSKGVPNKNVREIAGHPLLAWTIAACRKAESIGRVIVSTDSPAYADLAWRYGAEAPFLRPAEISLDRSTDYEFIAHALAWLEANGATPELIAHMRPTTPLRDPAVIDAAVSQFAGARGASALRSVHPMSESAYKTFEITGDGILKRVGSDSTALDAVNNPRQGFPDTFQANGYVDVLSAAFIRDSAIIHGDRVMPFKTDPVIEVDTESDFADLEIALARSPGMLEKLFD